MQLAVVHFSGICTHINRPYVPHNPDVHQVLLADVSKKATYKRFERLADLPPHLAKLLVARSTVVKAHPALPVSDDPTVSWELHGARISIEGNLMDMLLQPLSYPVVDGWTWGVIPSVEHWAPPPGGRIRPLADGLESRAAATLNIRSGELLPVDYDPRSGDSAAEWRFPASRVTVTIESPEVNQHLELEVPDDTSVPAVPLIQFQNLEARRGDAPPDDFLFHYYLLFDDVPDDAKVPTPLGRAEGGTSTGCSNSNYP